ncbi:MAG: D-glycero-beta-D-manno-heptose 1,7-bisphosphate 7-phosphatase [Porticoccaceae bacterium]
MTPWVILDRDGVINADSDHFIKNLDEWRPLPGSIDAIARLCHAGFQVAVATNQSGVGRGLIAPEALTAIHRELERLVAAAGGRIAGIFFCPHMPEDGCDCRKPRPGLLHSIATQFAIELAGIPAIGDSLRDLEAALAAGCQPILVRTGNGVKTECALASHPDARLHRVLVLDDLAAAADFLLTGQPA